MKENKAYSDKIKANNHQMLNDFPIKEMSVIIGAIKPMKIYALIISIAFSLFWFSFTSISLATRAVSLAKPNNVWIIQQAVETSPIMTIILLLAILVISATCWLLVSKIIYLSKIVNSFNTKS